jgi:hypothetical protein
MPNFEMYIPQTVTSVDKSLMMWKGHLSWKVNPSKRTRCGMKSFEDLAMYGILLFTLGRILFSTSP